MAAEVRAARLAEREARESWRRRVDAARVSLMRWLRRQLRQPGGIREHLEAAVENDDPAEARRVLAGVPFSDAQRRYLEDVLAAWERQSTT